ncbi:MAG: C4-dicarboxylate ABC transporter permease [Oceanospirillaceae bacterium]|uniref:TRAP transporter small permease n=1 Tax=unclassified Thalassolituus TaxID=2624967 RepID=UPI000C5DDFF5|nr:MULTISPECIES: TRAP transporter small permease [unclassified Thalassolituus]MAS25138.1 C4-dicarboxylate ABC transporter permease [Oceanospirillaceae bacterium]MBL36310.1 C4-dicarboxylate ABC transporter permease [Oceanospirillaceae bacterium]MBS53997.1 C4-dicarboxylate ABC transporter permease [Oceanospirillaceae bacterium]|tara:strand:+ start:79 stop:570 length:492 start_codon:yes stop_codon:yes gene_type:complete
MKKLLTLLHKAEDAILVLLLFIMIVLAGFDILARLLFGGGILWISPFLRVMVLWVGLFGALIATRSREHITIDLINRMAPDSVKRWLSVLTQAFAAFICGVIGWHSAEFVQAAWQYGDTVFGEVPAWPLQAIMPLTFSLMAVRFALQAINDLLTAVRPGAADA